MHRVMPWNVIAEELYQRIVAQVPDPYRDLVASSLRRGAEGRAMRSPSKVVTEDDVIVGFFDVTPEPFHQQVVLNLNEHGIDGEKYRRNWAGATARKTDLSRLLADLKAMSAVAEVPFTEPKVRAVIEAYAEFFQSAPVAMRTTTKPKEKRDLSVRYLDMMRKHDPDPLATALAKGFVKNDGHPVFRFYEESKERCGAFGFGVDLNVRSGFSKIWMAPVAGLATLEAVASLPSLPESAKNSVAHFARFGLKSFGLFGFDFVHRTTNLYFMLKHPEAPRDYSELLTDAGFRPNHPEALAACRPANVLYYSFSWDSPRAERMCFAVVCSNRHQVPVHLDPLVEKCVTDPAFMQDRQQCIYSVVWAPPGLHYFKIDNDYSGTMATDLVEAGRVGV
jgi:aromatic prenyltransferase